MALKFLVIAGEEICHDPLQSFWGVVVLFFSTVNRRRLGYKPLSPIVWLAPITGEPQTPVNVISILDCPEHSQTSPISTLLIVTGSPSLTVIVYGVNEATGVVTVINQLPSLSDFVVPLTPHEAVTLTEAFGPLQPQTFTLDCCCRTILSLTKAGR